MSSRARRIESGAAVVPFDWGGAPVLSSGERWPEPDEPVVAAAAPSAEALAAIERDAFAKGYAQGERAGHEAGAARIDAMLRRLAQTLDELQGLRVALIHRTERQVVELALAIARKVIQREVHLDPDLLMAMARVALDRLADSAAASIRLHPDDHAAVSVHGATTVSGRAGGVQIVADASVRRGGCVVRTDAGSIDVGVGAQLDELTRALLGDDDAVPAEVGADDAARV